MYSSTLYVSLADAFVFFLKSLNVFRNTLDELVQSSFELASEQLGRAFLTPDGATTRGIPRAKVLAQYNKLAVSTLSSPEPYAARLLEVPSLDELCWIVYAGE